MKKITIHKNELAKYFIKNYRDGAIKIGKERLNRWIDIPEYIQVEPAKTQEGIEDLFKGLGLSGLQVDYLLGLFNKFGNEIIGEDEDISSTNGRDGITGKEIQYYNAVRNQLRNYQRKLIKKSLEGWIGEFAPNLGHDPNNPFPLVRPNPYA